MPRPLPFRDRLRAFVLVLRRPELLIALAVTLLGVVAFFDAGPEARSPRIFSLLQNLELRSLDLRFQLRRNRQRDPRISIIGLDETTLYRLGTFPIPRNAYA